MYTTGLVNPTTEALEAIARATGYPRRWADHAREVLDSIDADPVELDRTVREDARWVGVRLRPDGVRERIAIPRKDVDAEHVLGLLVDACEVRLRATTPESLPLPDRRGVRASTAAQNLREHLRQLIRTRGNDARYIARKLSEVEDRLAVLADFDRFRSDCRREGAIKVAKEILSECGEILATLPRAADRPALSAWDYKSVRAAADAMLAHVVAVRAGLTALKPPKSPPKRSGRYAVVPRLAPPPDMETKLASLPTIAKWTGKTPKQLKHEIAIGDFPVKRISDRKWVTHVDKVLPKYKPEADPMEDTGAT
jgi:hypothetical protein